MSFIFRDVTQPIPGYITVGSVYWLCKNGDPTQALFWGQFPQYNSNPDTVKHMMNENMYKEVGGLEMVFMQLSYIPGFKKDINRLPGYYWVQDNAFHKWHIAFWDVRYWRLTGNKLAFCDDDFSFISPSPIPEPDYR